MRTTTSTRSLPNMSPSRPAIGVATEAESRYAVRIQLTPVGEVLSACCNSGSAGATIDWSSENAAAAVRSTANVSA